MTSMRPADTNRRSRSRPGLGAKLMLLTVSMLIACVLVEVGLRIRQGRSVFIFRRHPVYLHTFKPGAAYAHSLAPEDGGMTVPVVINRDGRRGPALDSTRPRIVVYGDSCIAAEYCPWEKTFTAVLESTLRERGRSHQVVNCGVSGYGPDQEFLRMREEAKSLAPDLIVVALTEWNDLGDLIRNKLFALDASGQLIARHPVLSPQLLTLFAATDPATPSLILHYVGRAAGRLAGRLPGSAPALAAAPAPTSAGFLEHYLPMRLEEYSDYQLPSQPVVQNLFGDTLDSDVILDPKSDSSRYKLRLLEAVLREMLAFGDSNRVGLVFVLIPSQFDLYPAKHGPRTPAQYPNYRPGALSTGYAEVLQKLQAPHVRLFDVFGTHPEDEMFLPKDGHWSPAGQRLAAESVARWIEEKSLLPKPGQRASPGRPAP